MADVKISQLTEKSALDGGEELVYAQEGANGKIKTSTIKEFVKELPSQTGNNGKFLKTDGSEPSRETVDALPSQTGQAGKVLTTNGTEASWQTPTGGISTLPGSPIDLKYKWNGSKEQFEALETYRADTEYNVIG